jgi:hypothetical protein
MTSLLSIIYSLDMLASILVVVDPHRSSSIGPFIMFFFASKISDHFHGD